jgi:hypothetical protein
MDVDRANDDLKFIQDRVRQGHVFWTYHVNMRLRQREIDRLVVYDSVDTYEVIERYTQSEASRYLPSCLVRAEYQTEPIHILFALDRDGNNVRVITVYRPDPQRWEDNYRRRKAI